MINAFLYVGLICLIGQIILDNTKLTPGHLTSIFVILGAFLSFLGWYDFIIDFAGAGSGVPILSFGNQLYQSALYGFTNGGVLGIFNLIYATTSSGISTSIIFAFLFSLFSQPKD